MNESELNLLFENLEDLTFNIGTTRLATTEPEPVAAEDPVEDLLVVETPDGKFVQSDGQLGFVEEHVSDRQYATLTAFEAITGAPMPARHGDRFRLCGRHWLIVGSIVEPPQSWTGLLDGTFGFVPWPDILAADFFGPAATPVVMVQPDTAISGTILSLYRHRYGEGAVERVA